MKKELRDVLEKAKATPDEPMFRVGDVTEMIGAADSNSVRDFDYHNITKTYKSPSGHRLYSYNNVQLIISLGNLVKKDISYKNIKALIEFEKKRGNDPIVYIQEFSEFLKKFKHKK